MKLLAQLFGSRVRAAIVQTLFVASAKPIHVRELARRCDCSLSAVQRELIRLRSIGVVRETKDGNRVYFDANIESPIFSDLASLVRKTDGIAVHLSAALSGSAVNVAFIFGSVAAKTESLNSDIDLMCIGQIGLRDVTARLAGLSQALGRDINYNVFSCLEWRDRLSRKDHFISTVMKQPKQFLIGDEDVLERMAT